MIPKRAANRSSYSSAFSKSKQNNENALYLSNITSIVINHAEFYNQYLLLCTNKSINIYNTDRMTKQQEIKVKVHTASFIPFTNYIIYPQAKGQEKQTMVIWNFMTNVVHAKVTFNFIIENMKASRRCILLASLQHLYVIHFPSLKPIYEGFAGNGIKTVFDISREGLTLAHTTQKKGEIIIRNFTNIETNKLLADIQSRSRGQSLSKMFKQNQAAFPSKRFQDEQEEIKKEIFIKAHNENVTIIRLSPNGYRVVSASSKGTIIRMYSCLNGELICEFRMGTNISLIVDIQFIAQGSQIVSLNDNNQINMFHARMSDLQLLSESSRRGYEISQQKNPTSIFSFLGFINKNLQSQYPFAYFKLDTKGIEFKEQKEKLQAELEGKKEKDKMHFFTEIKEIPQIQQSQINQHQLQQSANTGLNEKNKQKTNEIANQPSSPSSPFSPSSAQLPLDEVLQISQEHVQQRQQQQRLAIKFEKQKSLTSNSRFKSLKLQTVTNINRSIKSVGKLAKKQTQVFTFGQKEKNLHFRGIINFGITTNIKVLQSKYFFQLKYDPFNGGEMIQKGSFNLLKHSLFNDL